MRGIVERIVGSALPACVAVAALIGTCSPLSQTSYVCRARSDAERESEVDPRAVDYMVVCSNQSGVRNTTSRFYQMAPVEGETDSPDSSDTDVDPWSPGPEAASGD